LTPVTQKSSELVHAWAFDGDWNGKPVVGNTLTMEWPRRSGRQTTFPEMDRAEFVDVLVAKRQVKSGAGRVHRETPRNCRKKTVVDLASP
jgi:predicted NUDIX family NTP pyrophosphohydrolase